MVRTDGGSDGGTEPDGDGDEPTPSGSPYGEDGAYPYGTNPAGAPADAVTGATPGCANGHPTLGAVGGHCPEYRGVRGM